jgi:hypothetical protein
MEVRRVRGGQQLRLMSACIYCGAAGVGREHAIPGGLSGHFTLGAASCRDCERQSSAFELRLLRGPLLPIRVLFDLYEPDPKKPPPSLPVELSFPDGTTLVEDPPVQGHPAVLALPLLRPPLHLTGNTERPMQFTGEWAMQFNDPAVVAAYVRSRGANGLLYRSTIEVQALVQLIAKIGYCFAIGALGSDAIERTMPNPLVATVEQLTPFVGGDTSLAPADEDLHVVAVRVLDDGRALVDVRLLARYGTPTYTAIVGRTKERPGVVEYAVPLTGGWPLTAHPLPPNMTPRIDVLRAGRALADDELEGERRPASTRTEP